MLIGNASTSGDHGPVYDAGMWIVNNWPQITDAAQDPMNIALGAGALAGTAAAGGLGVRLGARGYYAACSALDPRPGTITVGRLRRGFTDHIVDPPARLSFPERCMHSQIVGPTRQGKTSLMLPWVVQDLTEGHTVFILETGGDLGLKALAHARSMGVPISYFNPADPNSNKWNPLRGDDVAKVAEQAIAALETISPSSDPYYEANNIVIFRHFIHLAAAYSAAIGEEPTLYQVKRLLEDEEYLFSALSFEDDGGYRVTLDGLDRNTKTWFENKYLRWTRAERERNASGLSLALDEVIGRDVVEAATTTEPDELALDLGGALDRGGLVLIRIPAAEVGPTGSRLLAAWALQLAQQETLTRGGRNHPACVYLDEVHTILGEHNSRAAESFGEWLVQAGKFGVAAHLAYQGFGMLPVGLRKVLETNASNKYISGRLGPEDAREAQRLMGEVQTEVEEVRRTRSTMFSGPGQTTTTKRTAERPRYSVEEIRGLRRGEWYFIGVKNGNLREPTIVKALEA